jgi:hypothetical protein
MIIMLAAVVPAILVVIPLVVAIIGTLMRSNDAAGQK